MHNYRCHLIQIKNLFAKGVEKRAVNISLLIGIYIMGWSFINPLFGIYLSLITESNTAVGLIFSILPLLGIIFALPMGKLADRVNKVKLLTLGFAGYMFVVIGYLYSWLNHTIVVITRVIHGLLMLVVWISAEALLRSSTKKIETAFSSYFFIQKVMYVIGGLLLITLLYLNIITLDNLYSIFIILFFFILLVSILTPIVLGISNLSKDNLFKGVYNVIEEDGFVVTEIKDIMKFGKDVHSMLIIRFAMTMFFTAISLFFPIMIYKMNFSLWEIVLISLVPQTFFIFLPKIPNLADKYGDWPLLLTLILISSMAGICIAFSDSIISFLIFYTICSGGILLSSPIINNIVTTNISKKHYGEVTGGLTLFNKTGALFGAAISGYLCDAFSYDLNFIVFSIALALITMLTFIYYKFSNNTNNFAKTYR
ncbi:MFS transporter [Candidatus Micrarchaeota archaeon]|nr:MFS transporter [Candidatus Micrarchaeota archaeon]